MIALFHKFLLSRHITLLDHIYLPIKLNGKRCGLKSSMRLETRIAKNKFSSNLTLETGVG